MTRKLSTYSGELQDFAQAQDFVLKGVWDALDHAPTVNLIDGSRLRPLTATLLLRSPDEEGDCFEVVGFDALRDERVATYEPEPTWRTTHS